MKAGGQIVKHFVSRYRCGSVLQTIPIIVLVIIATAISMTKKAAEPPTPGIPAAILESVSRAPSTFSDGLSLPKIIVFDLDYTLWPFWVDTHVTPPLKPKEGNTKAVDRWGESFAFYKDIPSILATAYSASITMSVASRTQAPDLAQSLLKLLNIPFSPSSSAQPSDSSSGSKSAHKRAFDFFSYMQIFPGDKRMHFSKIQKASGVAYEDMLFFDDEVRNRNVESLGVCMWLVRDGVTREEVDAGVREWRRRRGKETREGEWSAETPVLPGRKGK